VAGFGQSELQDTPMKATRVGHRLAAFWFVLPSKTVRCQKSITMANEKTFILISVEVESGTPMHVYYQRHLDPGGYLGQARHHIFHTTRQDGTHARGTVQPEIFFRYGDDGSLPGTLKFIRSSGGSYRGAGAATDGQPERNQEQKKLHLLKRGGMGRRSAKLKKGLSLNFSGPPFLSVLLASLASGWAWIFYF